MIYGVFAYTFELSNAQHCNNKNENFSHSRFKYINTIAVTNAGIIFNSKFIGKNPMAKPTHYDKSELYFL